MAGDIWAADDYQSWLSKVRIRSVWKIWQLWRLGKEDENLFTGVWSLERSGSGMKNNYQAQGKKAGSKHRTEDYGPGRPRSTHWHQGLEGSRGNTNKQYLVRQQNKFRTRPCLFHMEQNWYPGVCLLWLSKFSFPQGQTSGWRAMVKCKRWQVLNAQIRRGIIDPWAELGLLTVSYYMVQDIFIILNAWCLFQPTGWKNGTNLQLNTHKVLSDGFLVSSNTKLLLFLIRFWKKYNQFPSWSKFFTTDNLCIKLFLHISLSLWFVSLF